jgi:hypothetical protein
MREHDDYYNDENIRLYTPVLQRVIILAAVIIAVPVMMWTITTFVRGYVARPKVPALEHLASTNLPARTPAVSPSAPSPASSPADQSAPQRVDGASASDATSLAAHTRNGPPNLASAPDVGASPPTANSLSGVSLRTAPTPTPSSAITTATTTGDISTGSTLPAPPTPRPSLAPRSNDNTASPGAPSSSDRGLAWPNPNTTNPPDFAAPRLPPLPAPAPPAARTAAAEVLPAEEPIPGPIPMPRQRPGTFTVAAAAASGPVPLPRARPAAAPAETANTAIEPVSVYRPGLDSDR